MVRLLLWPRNFLSQTSATPHLPPPSPRRQSHVRPEFPFMVIPPAWYLNLSRITVSQALSSVYSHHQAQPRVIAVRGRPRFMFLPAVRQY